MTAKDKAAAKSKGGRPRVKFTPKQTREVETLAAVLSVEQIADYFGIASNTFTAIRDRQPEVFEAYKKGRAKAINDVGNGLLKKALDGDTASAIFYLKTQAGWRETTHIDHSSTDGSMTPTRIEIVALLQKS